MIWPCFRNSGKSPVRLRLCPPDGWLERRGYGQSGHGPKSPRCVGWDDTCFLPRGSGLVRKQATWITSNDNIVITPNFLGITPEDLSKVLLLQKALTAAGKSPDEIAKILGDLVAGKTTWFSTRYSTCLTCGFKILSTWFIFPGASDQEIDDLMSGILTDSGNLLSEDDIESLLKLGTLTFTSPRGLWQLKRFIPRGSSIRPRDDVTLRKQSCMTDHRNGQQ